MQVADDRLQKRFGKNIHSFPDSEWLTYGFGYSTPHGVFEEGSYFTKELSAQFGEVIFLCADSRNNQLEYEHSLDGAVLRKLSLIFDGCQSTWEWVEGEKEAWEDGSIFSAAHFARAQEMLSWEELPEEQHCAKEEMLRQLWARREYLLHENWPPGDAGFDGVIRKHFGLKLP
jgi:hypothetical protein